MAKTNTSVRLKAVKVPGALLQTRIKSIVACTSPIPCICITSENGYRMDIATECEDPGKSFQIVEAIDNPYYNYVTGEHLPIK